MTPAEAKAFALDSYPAAHVRSIYFGSGLFHAGYVVDLRSQERFCLEFPLQLSVCDSPDAAWVDMAERLNRNMPLFASVKPIGGE